MNQTQTQSQTQQAKAQQSRLHNYFQSTQTRVQNVLNILQGSGIPQNTPQLQSVITELKQQIADANQANKDSQAWFEAMDSGN